MKLYVVGIGPGEQSQLTPKAAAAIAQSQVVAGYPVYLELVAPLLVGKVRIETGMKGEVTRCKAAVEAALAGKRVTVISGGDAGIYGMASLVLELAQPYPQLEVEVIPGITAATAAAALLGAPLGHDFAVVSLSDLLTPWWVIEQRLRHSAAADLVICLYNPASKKRQDYLRQACDLVLEYQKSQTPCGVVRNAGRTEESVQVVTLGELRELQVDMFSICIVGSSNTKVIGNQIVTPRGYHT